MAALLEEMKNLTGKARSPVMRDGIPKLTMCAERCGGKVHTVQRGGSIEGAWRWAVVRRDRDRGHQICIILWADTSGC